MHSVAQLRAPSTPDPDAADPYEERHAIAGRIGLEFDGQAAFAVVAVGNNSRLGAEVVRVIGELLDRLDDAELRLLDRIVLERQRRRRAAA